MPTTATGATPQPQGELYSAEVGFRHTHVQLPTPFSMHFLKVKEQEVHSQPDEKATHAFSGGLVGFTFYRYFPLPLTNTTLYFLLSLSSQSVRVVNMPPPVRVSSTSSLRPWFKMVMLMSNPTPLPKTLALQYVCLLLFAISPPSPPKNSSS